MASPTDGRPLPRRIAAALAIAGAISAVTVPAAAAAPLTVRVVNTRGVEQASLVSASLASCGGPCGLMGTDGNGHITLDVLAGDSLSVTRGDLAPEGAGVGYTVTDPVPADPVTITVPALPGTVSPGIDAAEAWLLEHVNAERAALGRAPLTLSSTLSRAADAYAHYLAANDLFSHTALASPGVRAVDQGWPVPGGSSVGEALALAPSKEFALQGWKQSGPHWTLLMMDGLDSVGVGQAGGRWIMMPANCAIATAAERCGLGSDPAVVPVGSRDPVPSPGPGTPERARPGGAEPRHPALRMSLRKHGRRLVVRIRVLRGRGALRVAVSHGPRRAHLRHRHAGSLHRYTARLPRRGRWTISVLFAGRGDWTDRRLPRRAVRVR
jgi:hypothetical protein